MVLACLKCHGTVHMWLIYLQNPAIDSASMLDSAPPATMTSASPKRIIRAASPMECAPLAHAVTAAWLGPCHEKPTTPHP